MKTSTDRYFVGSKENSKNGRVFIGDMETVTQFEGVTIEERDLTLEAALMIGNEISQELGYRFDLTKEEREAFDNIH